MRVSRKAQAIQCRNNSVYRANDMQQCASKICNKRAQDRQEDRATKIEHGRHDNLKLAVIHKKDIEKDTVGE